jgi:hypothetical protein
VVTRCDSVSSDTALAGVLDTAYQHHLIFVFLGFCLFSPCWSVFGSRGLALVTVSS